MQEWKARVRAWCCHAYNCHLLPHAEKGPFLSNFNPAEGCGGGVGNEAGPFPCICRPVGVPGLLARIEALFLRVTCTITRLRWKPHFLQSQASRPLRDRAHLEEQLQVALKVAFAFPQDCLRLYALSGRSFSCDVPYSSDSQDEMASTKFPFKTGRSLLENRGASY